MYAECGLVVIPIPCGNGESVGDGEAGSLFIDDGVEEPDEGTVRVFVCKMACGKSFGHDAARLSFLRTAATRRLAFVANAT
jgi:hypothetical protein